MAAFGGGKALQIDAVISDEFFVGGDDAFAGFESATHPASSWIEAASQLDNHVHIGGEHGVGVFAPDDARGHPVGALACDAAVEDVRQLQAVRLGLDKNARHRAAHRAEAKDGNAEMAGRARLARVRGWSVGRRSGTVHLRHLNLPLVNAGEAKQSNNLMIPEGTSAEWSVGSGLWPSVSGQWSASPLTL